jgi:hypothetical protein
VFVDLSQFIFLIKFKHSLNFIYLILLSFKLGFILDSHLATLSTSSHLKFWFTLLLSSKV